MIYGMSKYTIINALYCIYKVCQDATNDYISVEFEQYTIFKLYITTDYDDT